MLVDLMQTPFSAVFECPSLLRYKSKQSLLSFLFVLKTFSQPHCNLLESMFKTS